MLWRTAGKRREGRLCNIVDTYSANSNEYIRQLKAARAPALSTVIGDDDKIYSWEVLPPKVLPRPSSSNLINWGSFKPDRVPKEKRGDPDKKEWKDKFDEAVRLMRC